MRPGKEYELFVYEKFKSFFKGFDVTINDKIVGKQSNIKREIDISIKGNQSGVDILYLVQCKDHNKSADIKIIGEFSSVIKDLNASKGFLICSKGFTKTIHDYARNVGIELVTVEDINSKKWKANVEIPIFYFQKKLELRYTLEFTATEELVEKNKEDIKINREDLRELSFDLGRNSLSIFEYINFIYERDKFDVSETQTILLNDPYLKIKFIDIWIPVKIHLTFIFETIKYIKYITPFEYSQISYHLTNETIPIYTKINVKEFEFDEKFIKILDNILPVYSPINIEIEENIFPLDENSMKYL